jgi:hypothetical protein
MTWGAGGIRPLPLRRIGSVLWLCRTSTANTKPVDRAIFFYHFLYEAPEPFHIAGINR